MSEPSPTEVRDLADLVPLLELDSIEFYEIHGRVNDGFADDEATEAAQPPEAQVEIGLNPALRIRDDGLDVRCRLRTLTADGHVTVDAAAFYTSKSKLELSEGLANQFAENVGIMVLIPYIRQVIDDMSMRLMFPGRILLPVMPRGAIKFADVPDANAIEAAKP